MLKKKENFEVKFGLEYVYGQQDSVQEFGSRGNQKRLTLLMIKIKSLAKTSIIFERKILKRNLVKRGLIVETPSDISN